MAKIRRGGYTFVRWKGDHTPDHVHVYKDGRFVLKWDLEEHLPMKGVPDGRILSILDELKKEGWL